MQRYFVTALTLILIATSATAQTWAEQQRRTNMEVELFQQREEMERMRQDNKRALEQQRREMERERLDLQQSNKRFQLKHDYSTNTPAPDSTANTMREQAAYYAQLTAENKALVLREEDASPIVFREEFFTKLQNNMIAQKIHMTSRDWESVRYSIKAMWLRIVKSAEKGNPIDQRKLGIGYLEGEEIQRNYRESVKWLRKAAAQNDDEAITYLERMAELNP